MAHVHNNECITVNETVALTGHALGTLSSWRSRGRGPLRGHRHGSGVCYRLSEVRAYVAMRGDTMTITEVRAP